MQRLQKGLHRNTRKALKCGVRIIVHNKIGKKSVVGMDSRAVQQHLRSACNKPSNKNLWIKRLCFSSLGSLKLNGKSIFEGRSATPLKQVALNFVPDRPARGDFTRENFTAR